MNKREIKNQIKNRKRKFRAWDKVNKRMLYRGIWVGEYGLCRECVEEDAGPTYRFRPNANDFIQPYLNEERLEDYDSPLIGMQYTGLKDKNGKEIYEGDILKETGKYSFILEVFYSDLDNAFMVWNKYLQRVNLGGYYSEDVEVIGNKFENPELLGQKEK